MEKLFLLFMILSCVSCLKDEEQGGAKQVGYKEYTMTVAPEKREGVGGTGKQFYMMVYAVKIGSSTSWSPFWATPKGFEYEQGYEYLIKIAETNWVDYNMGDPAWTEYELKEVFTKITCQFSQTRIYGKVTDIQNDCTIVLLVAMEAKVNIVVLFCGSSVTSS